jgi:hypothetical protein
VYFGLFTRSRALLLQLLVEWEGVAAVDACPVPLLFCSESVFPSSDDADDDVLGESMCWPSTLIAIKPT